MNEPQIRGTALLACKNHPTYRWIKTKYGPGFGGHGVYIFRGDSEGLPASPYNMTERNLADCSPEFQEEYRAKYTPECDCSIHDLYFLDWA